MTEQKIISRVAEEVVSQKKIITYLNVIKNNPNLSILNHCLIYLQNPLAEHVCGINAWKSQNRAIIDANKTIVLLFPSINRQNNPKEFLENNIPQVVKNTNIQIYLEEPIYCNHYIEIIGYDFHNTRIVDDEENKIENKKSINYLDIILNITQATVEYANIVSGKYDGIQNIFYIPEILNNNDNIGIEEVNKELLSLYIEYIFDSYVLTDKVLKYAVKYCLFEYFHFNQSIEEPIFSKLNNYTISQKITFLENLDFLIRGIIQDFEGYFLNFNETCILNNVLNTAEPTEVYILLDKIADTVSDSYLKKEIIKLKSKLQRCIPGFLDDLYDLKENQNLFTYPPKKVLLDNTDYLREERRKLLSVDI